MIEEAQARRPSAPPSMNAFAPKIAPMEPTASADKTISEMNSLVVNETAQPGPALPEGGLPPGWTAEQWGHYGQQYLEAQGSQTTVFTGAGTDLK
jgi:hypothetical protein